MSDCDTMSKQHSTIRRQGMLFCALTVIVLVATPLLVFVNDQVQLFAIASAIFLLGLPHGALDTLFAQRLYGISTRTDWFVFSLLYVSLALAVIAVWWFAPRLFLIFFLSISAFHFSADPDIKIGLVARIFYGSAIIVLPAALHDSTVTALFGQLVGLDAASDIVTALKWLCAPALVGLALALKAALPLDRLAAAEILGVALLAIFAEPLIAFTLFFCGMHSPRHFLRSAFLTGNTLKNLMINFAAIPTIISIAVAVAGFMLFAHLPLNERLLRIVFVGLAALTVPHMLLVEQVRFRCWRFPAGNK